MNSRIIALDIGNVCLKIHYDRCLSRLGYLQSVKVPERFMNTCDLLETGKISEEEWMEIYQEETSRRFSNNELLQAWNLILGEEMPGMLEAVREINSSGFRIIFFSDTSKIHINHVYRILPLCVFVSGGVYSFDAGAKKPQPEMFKSFEKRYGKPFLYTDDKKENIEAGRAHGWTSHGFVSAELLLKEFKSLSGSLS